MIYKFSTHCILQENIYKNRTISLVIGTLELVVDYDNKCFLYVQGFFPLVNSVSCSINIPDYQTGKYYFNCLDYDTIQPYDVVDLINRIPEYEKYFKLTNSRLNNESLVYYDQYKGIIKFGCSNLSDKYIKINKNIIIGIDFRELITCIYIFPDLFDK